MNPWKKPHPLTLDFSRPAGDLSDRSRPETRARLEWLENWSEYRRLHSEGHGHGEILHGLLWNAASPERLPEPYFRLIQALNRATQIEDGLQTRILMRRRERQSSDPLYLRNAPRTAGAYGDRLGQRVNQLRLLQQIAYLEGRERLTALQGASNGPDYSPYREFGRPIGQSAEGGPIFEIKFP